MSMSFGTRESLDNYFTAMQQIVNRYDILRTSFVWKEISSSVQVVWREAPLSITELQLDPAHGPVAKQLKEKFDPRNYRLDLAKASLVRFIATQDQSTGDWVLVQLQHHLIGDHSTLELMNSEIQVILEGQGHTLPQPEPYRNLIAQVRLGAKEAEHERFFKTMLSDVDTPSLPYGMAVTHADSTMMTESHQALPQELNDRLRSQAKRLGVSLASICHLAWAMVIAQTSGQERVVFGTVLLGRMQASTSSSQTMGLFINTLPVLVDVHSQRSVDRSVKETHARLAALLEHELASLALAQRCSSVPAGTPLFSSLLNYRHNIAKSTTASSSIPILKDMTFLDVQEFSNYPVTLSVDDDGRSLVVAAQALQPIESGRVCGYMQQALESLVRAMDNSSKAASVASLEVVPAEERALLVETWNTSVHEEDRSLDQCLHQLFEQQVAQTPDAVAVVDEGQSLTYAELNARANRLAHQLVELGVKADALVGICVERSFGMMASILSVLKAGGAYVPLDPSFASDRLRDTLRDANPVCLLADSKGRDAVAAALPSDLPVLDPNSSSTEYSSANVELPHLASSSNLAYVIYTSGTTGKPKGVMLEHKGAVNLVKSRQAEYGFGARTRSTQFFTFSFDSSVCEIFPTLCLGGTLHLLKDCTRLDKVQLWRYLEKHAITHAVLTPTVLQDCKDLWTLNTPLTVILAGEALTPALVNSIQALIPKGAVINEYGPTETTVAATYCKLEAETLTDTIPIGRPISCKRVYILDAHRNPVPLGAVGELYIGGIGVARGYFKRPDLTVEKFLLDPFVDSKDARMYRTGDQARYLPDGSIHYLGRNDDQVKIRGFRVELGEIEARLAEHPLTSDAVVLALGKEASKRLVAYVISKAEENAVDDPSQLALELRTYLVSRLPEYMVPSAFVRLDAFPLTPNGKLDRRALPAPTEEAFAREAYEAPRDDVERAVAAIWADVLHLDQVSRNDSFFALGGHSLLAVRMMNRVVAALGANVLLASLFASPSLSAFAEEIRMQQGQQEEKVQAIERVSRTEDMPLSFAQQRMWFLAQLDGVSNTYHIPLSIRLHGPLNREAWRLALTDLVARHEALRSVFAEVGGQPYVQILTYEELSVRYVDLRGAADVEGQLKTLADAEIHEPFDMVQGPLIRAKLLQVADDEHVLVLTMHHIVSDGWSVAIVARELSRLYTAHCKSDSNLTSLSPLAIQYPDYAAWQRQWFKGDRLQVQAEYWHKTLEGIPVLLDLPTDRPRPPQQSYVGARIPIALDAELTGALKRLCKTHGITLFMAIMAAWSAVLARLSGQDDVVIGTPTANRGRHEVEPLIGLFVNTLALRVDLSEDPTARVLLDRVRRATLAAQENQDLPFEQVVEIAQPPRKMDQTPLFQVMFGWQSNEVDCWKMLDLQASEYALDNPHVKFDLELALWEAGDRVVGSLGYATALFDEATIERHVGYLVAMLKRLVVADVDRPVADVDLLSSAERMLQVETWNDATTEGHGEMLDSCIHYMFEEHVERAPESTAAVFNDQALTYAELNARANRLAHQIIELGVQPDSLVGICVERSLDMIVSVLAVLKAGGAYVPLDPSSASDRLIDTLADAAPVCLLADRKGREVVGKIAQLTVPMLDPATAAVESTQYPASNIRVSTLTSRHLAYVIYTSGTTGKPKGVLVEHRNFVNMIAANQTAFGFGPSSRATQFFAFSTDGCVHDIFCSLCLGGTLHVLDDSVRQDKYRLWRYIEEKKLTHLTITPSVLQDCTDLRVLDSSTTFILAAEALPPSLVRSLQAVIPNGRFFNGYGPTETTVSATCYQIDGRSDIIPIGRPFTDKRFYILDKHHHPVPLGGVGEMFIGGSGVTRGYLNRPDLTAERFLPDPFVNDAAAAAAGARMYKTGDLAKYLPDGNMLFMGRNDQQVKIRGFRIELGEIEACLANHPRVGSAVAHVVDEDTNKRLVAYVVTKQASHSANEETLPLPLVLRNYLKTLLPEYMVPSAYVRMDAFPLTHSGKLDRRSLPEPTDEAFAREEYEKPQGEIEKALASIWADLLRLDR
ncbi:hypothetical protein BG006_001914, partial [Podila minutissima]